MIIFLLFSFCNYVILGEHILNISKTIFSKLIFHLQLGDQLPDIVLRKFYMHSAYVSLYSYSYSYISLCTSYSLIFP